MIAVKGMKDREEAYLFHCQGPTFPFFKLRINDDASLCQGLSL